MSNPEGVRTISILTIVKLVAVGVVGALIIFFVIPQLFFQSDNPTDVEQPKLRTDLIEGTSFEGEVYSGEVLTTVKERIDFHISNSDKRWDCILYSYTFEFYIECADLGEPEEHPQQVIDEWTPYQVGDSIDYEFTIDFDRPTTFDPDLKNELTNYFNFKVGHTNEHGINWNEQIDGTVTFWWQMK